MNEHALEYIKIQWADIHHSRQQEWKALGVVAGIFFAIANVQDPRARIFLGLLGISSSFLGACISWQHHTIFLGKMSVISRLERQLGIQYPMRTALFPVQVLLYLLFGGISSAFVGTTLGYLAEIPKYDFLRPFAYPAGLVSFVLFIVYALVRRLKAVKVKSYGFRHPFYAEFEELNQCIKSIEDIPLKLVAGELLSRPRIKEVSWELPRWTCGLDGDLIIKPVLLNRRDVFQFSLANVSSKQDWHYHDSVFEMYISYDPIDLEYQEQGAERKKQALHVNQGVLIIPPGIPHKVSLAGNTFVFQATLASRNLGEDKVLVRED